MYRPHDDYVGGAHQGAPITDDPVAERLRRAAQIIRERGWCQGEIEDRRGRVCLINAMALADVNTPTAQDRVKAATGNPTWLHEWNNARGRTAAEVIDALERAANAAP